MYWLEFLAFMLFASIGICFLYFCCAAVSAHSQPEAAQSSDAQPTPHGHSSRHGESNKTNDDLPPVFSITGNSSMYRTPSNRHDFDFVHVDIEEQPPPHYDDAIVIKPLK